MAEAYDVLLDGIMNEATIEPITEPTFKLLAYNLLHLCCRGIVAPEGPRETLWPFAYPERTAQDPHK